MKSQFIKILLVLLLSVSVFYIKAINAATFLHVDATESDYIGEGTESTIFDISPTIRNFIPQGKRLYIEALGWNILLGAVSGQELIPGNYELAKNTNNSNLAFPYLVVSSTSRGCNYSIGRFVIHELEIGLDDVVSRIAIDFEYTCYDIVEEYLFGQIRYNSDIPEILDRPHAAAGRDQLVDEGAMVRLNANESFSGNSRMTSYNWNQLSGPSVVFNGDSSHLVTFIAPNVEPGGAIIEIQLEVKNEAGLTHTDTVNVRVQDINDPHTYFYNHFKQNYFPVHREYFYPEDFGQFDILNSSQYFRVNYKGFSDTSVLFSAAAPLAKGYYLDLEEQLGPIRPSFFFDPYCGGLPRFMPGRIFIHEIEYDLEGNINKLAADFIEHCPGFNYGIIRINSSYPPYRDKPYAVAGMNKSMYETSRVVLNGNYSDSGSDLINGNYDEIISYSWRQLGGTSVQLFDADKPVSYFNAPSVLNDEKLIFELSVIDKQGLTDSDQVEITILPTDRMRSFATISGGSYVTKRGVVIDEFSATTQFFENPSRLIISYKDGDGWTVSFRTLDGNPLVVGSYSSIDILDDLVKFSGDGRACSYETGNYTINSLSRDLNNEIDDLSIDFEHFCSSFDVKSLGKIRVNQIADGDVPIANAGPDLIVNEGDYYMLDATSSHDNDGQVILYSWRQLSGQTSSLHYFDKKNASNVELFAHQLPLGVDSLELVFELTVHDDDGFSSQDIVKVKVVRTNSAPIANDDYIEIEKNSVVDIAVKANDTDLDGVLDTLLYLKEPEFGERVFNSTDTIRYIPDQDFIGMDSLEYAVLDNTKAYSNTAKVTIKVVEPVDQVDDSGNDTSSNSSRSGGGSITINFFLVLLLFMVGTRLFRWQQ